MKATFYIIAMLAALSSSATAEDTNCVTNYVGATAYTRCNAPHHGGNFPATAYDPNAFTNGADDAQAYDKIRNRNLAYAALSNNQPEAAVKYLYAAGDIDQAMAVEKQIDKKRAAQTVTQPPKSETVNGVVYTPYSQ